MTLIVIVLEVLAILANFCVPYFHGVSLKMKAADIAREMHQVGTAAESAHGQRGTWPDDRATGISPPELASFLPPGFSFARGDYQLDWEHWTLEEGASLTANGEELAGVTVSTQDPRLAAMVAAQLREGDTRFTLGNRTTLVIAEPSSAER